MRSTRKTPRIARVAVISALAALAGCITDDPERTQPRGSAAPPDEAESAARVASLRAAFAGLPGKGVGARFEATASGALRAVVPEAARRNLLRTATVTLPALADGAVQVVDDASGLGVRFALEGASTTAASITADGVALYAGAAPGGGDVVHRVAADSTEDYLYFAARPAQERVRYAVDLDGARGLRLLSNSLELLDQRGVPRLRVAPPSVSDRHGALHAATLSVEGCAFDADPRSPVDRAVTPPGAERCTLIVDWSAAHVSYPALVDPTWKPSGSMFSPRAYHTATALSNGDLLLTGGYDYNNAPQISAEIFVVKDGIFTATGALQSPRARHTATVVAMDAADPANPAANLDVVLIAGGLDGLEKPQKNAESYHAATGTFQLENVMGTARSEHTATALSPSALPSKVLIAGGVDTNGLNLAKAEIYDPETRTFTTVSDMKTSRAGHTATLLPSGDVLLAGGLGPLFALATAEVFTPGTSSFQALGSVMTSQRAFATATVFTDAANATKVLIAGGANGRFGSPGTVSYAAGDVFDPTTSTFKQTQAMAAPRANHAAVVLPSGNVLLIGGASGSDTDSARKDTEAFVPSTNGFAFDAELNEYRVGHTATRLNTNQVLVTGGSVGTPASSTELLLRSNGDPCTVKGECASSFCVKNICCDSQCSGSCFSCFKDEQDDQDPDSPPTQGLCLAVKADETVSENCDADANIEFALLCDGTGGIKPTGKSCKAFACDADFVHCAASCTLAAGCSDDGWCNVGTGKCEDKLASGLACADDRQCKPSSSDGVAHCVDGVCCDSGCSGQCEACDVEGLLGKCAQVVGDPHPGAGRSACTADPLECGGTCGEKRTSCDYPDATCGASTCTDAQVTANRCKDGTCSDPTTTGCPTGNKCDVDGVECQTVCASNTECADGFQCRNSLCVLIDTTACEGHTLRFPDKPDELCDPYVCSNDNTCRESCNSVKDCVSPFVCDAQGKCVSAPSSPAVPTGCSVPAAPTGSTPVPGYAIALLAALGAFGARRLRREPSEVKG